MARSFQPTSQWFYRRGPGPARALDVSAQGALPADGAHSALLGAEPAASRSRQWIRAGIRLRVWWGIFAPRGVARDLVSKLNAEIVRIHGLPDLKERYAVPGVQATSSTPDRFADYIKSEAARFAKVLREDDAKVRRGSFLSVSVGHANCDLMGRRTTRPPPPRSDTACASRFPRS